MFDPVKLALCMYMCQHGTSQSTSLINTVVVYAYWTGQAGRDVYVKGTFVLETSSTTGGHKMQCKLKREEGMNL